jgi:hypothetical protein
MQGTNRNGLYSIFGLLPRSRAKFSIQKSRPIGESCSSGKRSC